MKRRREREEGSGRKLSLMEAERTAVANILRPGVTESTLLEAGVNALGFADTMSARDHDDSPALACRAGCAACCRQLVTATIPEVLVLQAFIEQHLSAEVRAALLERIEAVLADARGLDVIEYSRRRVACPFLVDERCSVYEARPLACRGYNSVDADACEKKLDDLHLELEADGWIHSVNVAVQDGVERALSDIGLDGGHLRLVPAVLALLKSPDAIRSWIAGRPPRDLMTAQEHFKRLPMVRG